MFVLTASEISAETPCLLTSHLPPLPVCLTLLLQSLRGGGGGGVCEKRMSDWGWRSNLLLIMSCHLQTGAPTHPHRPRVHVPLTCYSHWCLIMCLFINIVWTLIKIWPLTFSIKIFWPFYVTSPSYTHIRTQSCPFGQNSDLLTFVVKGLDQSRV